MSDPSPRTITLTVGTAGHIDHGKTELVKFLTGCNTDVLPEEKARGMTINIGFATCELPNHRRVGIVDVPGHERFIHNMVAGAAGVDVVILVVAADDGVMPQTIEHFHIIRMLGVKSGMVVITKSDLVEPGRIEDVRAQVEALVAGSFLEGCPILPFSAKTGEGFDAFHSTFVSLVDRTAERNADGPFRMHVERAFILKGRGTIISGIPCSGRVNDGDGLELLPEGKATTVRGIQVYGQDSDEALNGECVALKMSDISKSDPQRGMVLAEPGFFAPAKFINARFQYLPHVTGVLRPRTAVRFHIGTTAVAGHVVLPELKPMKPGEEGYVQFQLKSPVVAAPGDFFVARLLSPAITLGGGTVIAPVSMKIRRSQENWQDECLEREEAFKSPDTALRYVLSRAGGAVMDLRQVAHQAFMNEEAARGYLDAFVERGEAVALPGGRYLWGQDLEKAADDIVAGLGQLHDDKPLSAGFPKKDVVRQLEIDKPVLDRAMEQLLEQGVVVSTDSGLVLKERMATLSPKQQKIAERIEAVYRDADYATPRAEEVAVELGMPGPLVDPVLDHLLQVGVLVDVGEHIIFHREMLDAARDRLVAMIEADGSVETGAFRDALGTTRKYLIPLLEYFDRIRLTVRKGNARTLRT